MPRLRSIVVAAALARTVGAHAQPHGDAEVYDEWNPPVFAAGAAVFGSAYTASAIVSATSTHAGADHLAIPIVGPWLALRDWGKPDALLVADGILQLAGVAAIIHSFVFPAHHRVITRVARDVYVAPMGAGICVVGRF
jgi:hypothetical protein